MKPLAIWLAAFAVLFGGLALLTNALRDTSRVFVVVDTSFVMGEVWGEALAELDQIGDRDHAEFALATEKELVHSWQDELTLGTEDPFAPCDFSAVGTYAEVAEADDLILITSPGSCDVSAFVDWEVVLLAP